MMSYKYVTAFEKKVQTAFYNVLLDIIIIN